MLQLEIRELEESLRPQLSHRLYHNAVQEMKALHDKLKGVKQQHVIGCASEIVKKLDILEALRHPRALSVEQLKMLCSINDPLEQIYRQSCEPSQQWEDFQEQYKSLLNNIIKQTANIQIRYFWEQNENDYEME